MKEGFVGAMNCRDGCVCLEMWKDGDDQKEWRRDTQRQTPGWSWMILGRISGFTSKAKGRCDHAIYVSVVNHAWLGPVWRLCFVVPLFAESYSFPSDSFD